MGKSLLAERVQSLLAPAPEVDPEDAERFDDGTRAAAGLWDDADDDEAAGGASGTVPRRRLVEDVEDERARNAGLVKSSRAELFGDQGEPELFGAACVFDDGDGDDEDGDESVDGEEEDDDDDDDDEDDESVEDDDNVEEDDEEAGPGSSSRPRGRQRSVFESISASSDLDAVLAGFDREDLTEESARVAEAPARAAEEDRARRCDALHSELMEVRVQLQTLMAIAAREPVAKDPVSAGGGLEALVDRLLALADTTATPTPAPATCEEGGDPLWARIEATRDARRGGWETTLEAWRRRTHLGAATKNLSSLGGLGGPFAQARAALHDVVRCQRKMHPKRADGTFDTEQYDDSTLYAAQLRDFVDSSAAAKKKHIRGTDSASDAIDLKRNKSNTTAVR